MKIKLKVDFKLFKHSLALNMHTLYSLTSILTKENTAKSFLQERGFYRETLACPKCGDSMHLNILKWAFRCSKRSCNVYKSLNANTFLANSRLKAHQMLMLARLWISKISVTSAIDLTGHSPNTVVEHWKFFRQLVSSTLEPTDTVIGGENIIVEVDETKLGKRKYNRGNLLIQDITWRVCGALLEWSVRMRDGYL
jgi:hypothetical protein